MHADILTLQSVSAEMSIQPSVTTAGGMSSAMITMATSSIQPTLMPTPGNCD